MSPFNLGADSKRVLKAIGRAFALIEFSPDGKIITANENFCKLLGYELAEIKGQHHRMFVAPGDAAKPEYREFWSKLGRGESNAGDFRRMGKGGREIWLQASYNAVLSRSGKVLKIVELAMDVTASKMQALVDKGKIDAISRAQSVLEFSPDGTILTANENLLKTAGYRLDEIVGRHRSIFVDPATARADAYREFWDRLLRGETIDQELKRVGKGGKEVWIQSSYNPIFDAEHRVIRVVNFLRDITALKIEALDNRGKIDAISRAQGIIEFSPDGTILTANDNLLKLIGYRLEEIQGRHHSMFVDSATAQSEAYRELWSRLNRGEYIVQEAKRIGKGGKQIWLQSSYNPIYDDEHRLIRIVNFLTDVTGRAESLEKIGAGLARLSDGDLQQRFSTPFVEAFEPFRADFNAALESLDHSMLAVDSTTQAIQGGTREISSAAGDLSQRTQQQASSLEETAAALAEVTATVRKTAESAVHARDVVGGAKEDAEKTGAVVSEAVAAMGAIDNSSKQISQIIGVIDEIAFQTNLLALNAGVEAARAGDAGRGFAVVASEVRALAQRSADAAKEIKALIRTSEERVGQGAALVARTGEALQRIVSQVLELAEIVGSISTGAQEESTALEQVNKAVGDMDGVTQANAAMVEQTTAAVQNLSQQAEELAALVGKYKVSGDEGGKLRQELKRVAPHAFRGRPNATSRPSTPASRGKDTKPRAKVVAAANDSWTEF